MRSAPWLACALVAATALHLAPAAAAYHEPCRSQGATLVQHAATGTYAGTFAGSDPDTAGACVNAVNAPTVLGPTTAGGQAMVTFEDPQRSSAGVAVSARACAGAYLHPGCPVVGRTGAEAGTLGPGPCLRGVWFAVLGAAWGPRAIGVC